jgi:hypothetical protein
LHLTLSVTGQYTSPRRLTGPLLFDRWRLTRGLVGPYDSKCVRAHGCVAQRRAAAAMSTDLHLYTVLGVERDASPDEIRGAYRRAALASHPDLHPGDASAVERFKRVQIAYEVLGDPARRAAYDASPARASAGPVGVSARVAPEAPISLARELGETVRAIRVMARRSGFRRRVTRLIRYLERL